ncbi:hypothetical protein L226DRAFT_569860 [Lentinus tigrinus ALCF2SS1-7]|uniref:inositol-3-phosphate synthase n=1 Tax=Lentinus tigrinus ALCF2SS1-6 TaxID=1328759 RepID=A0A5C2SL06_9APHY|nr:hypothetical protein L227DRAFT_608084 [Lentinus tigrinus ALCF2SS1-6]RPD76622.1 hypothetical protein L226DRAFT_569860 [Lentinus tigrinus ALCF2SS1-7]
MLAHSARPLIRSPYPCRSSALLARAPRLLSSLAPTLAHFPSPRFSSALLARSHSLRCSPLSLPTPVIHAPLPAAPPPGSFSVLSPTTTTTAAFLLVSKTPSPVPIPIAEHALPTLILTVLLTASSPEFLVIVGIKLLSVASYNHLGNNDSRNLSTEPQFKSKQIWKSSVVDDMVATNALLFKPPQLSAPVGTKDAKGQQPNHIIFHQDLLLATPLILNLRAPVAPQVPQPVREQKPQAVLPVLSLLSCILNPSLARPGTDVVNSVGQSSAQRARGFPQGLRRPRLVAMDCSTRIMIPKYRDMPMFTPTSRPRHYSSFLLR